MGIYVATASWTISQGMVKAENQPRPYPMDSDGSFSPLIITAFNRRVKIRGFSVSCDGRQAGGDPLLVRVASTYLTIFSSTESDPPYDRNDPHTQWYANSTSDAQGFEWPMVAPPSLWEGSISPVAGLIDIQFPETERPTVQSYYSFWVNVLVGTQVEDVHLKAVVTYEA